MINLSDKLTAKTIDHVVADSHEIEYEKGKTTTKGNTVADELTNLAQKAKNADKTKKEFEFFGIGIDTERGVLRIGGKMYKLISYEGDAEFDEYVDATVFVASTETIDNPEFQSVITDAEEKILYGVYANGTETDIDLTGLRIVNPETGAEVKVQLVVNDLKNKVNE